MQNELLTQLPEPWKPHGYQKKAVKFVLESAAAGLLLDPGLGKTSITLAALKILKKKKMFGKVLLVAPLRVCYLVWPKEVKKWSDFNGLKMVILHGPNKEQALKEDADIYLINPEGLDWLLQAEKSLTPRGKVKVTVNLSRWRALGFDMLVIDELSKFKHTNTNRFKALKFVLGTFQRRWGLTGSPASNGLLDLFGQCYVLDQGRSLGPYISNYRKKYFEQGYDGFSWKLRDGAEDEIYERISPLMLRMAAEDYIDMPILIENNIQVDLPDDVMGVYIELESELITMIDKNLIVAANAASASMKCRQVANGGIYLTPEVEELIKAPKSKREWINLHEAKTDALSDLVDELQGSPLLVAYDFEHDLDRLRKKFPKAIFACDYNMTQLVELEAKWNKGEIPLFFGHPQSIGHGLNLQERGHHVCWHSLTWNYELYDQFIRRVRRQGNKSKKVFVHHVIARNTIDEVILSALKSKKRGQNALFEALKSLRK